MKIKLLGTCRLCDNVLSMLIDNQDFVETRELFKDPPIYLKETLDFLREDGMVVYEQHVVRITGKGKVKVASGGYVGQYRRDKLVVVGIIVGIVSGVAGLAVSLYSLMHS